MARILIAICCLSVAWQRVLWTRWNPLGNWPPDDVILWRLLPAAGKPRVIADKAGRDTFPSVVSYTAEGEPPSRLLSQILFLGTACPQS